MFDLDAGFATNGWWYERQGKGAHHFILRGMPTLFTTLIALHKEAQKLPLKAISGYNSTLTHEAKSYHLTWGLNMSNDEYATFRSILALTGDIYDLLKPMKDFNSIQLQELHPFIKPLYDKADEYRELRNAFTHIGETITNMDKHGVDGPLLSSTNIQYEYSARGCVHFIWNNATQTVHFTHYKQDLACRFDKTSFQEIFNIGRNIYTELINHTGATGYTAPNVLLPP